MPDVCRQTTEATRWVAATSGSLGGELRSFGLPAGNTDAQEVQQALFLYVDVKISKRRQVKEPLLCFEKFLQSISFYFYAAKSHPQTSQTTVVVKGGNLNGDTLVYIRRENKITKAVGIRLLLFQKKKE